MAGNLRQSSYGTAKKVQCEGQGLSAARLLKHEGFNVIVLEARGRVGGRTYTVQGDQFGYTDLGGAYVGPTQRRVQRLAKESGLDFHKVNTKGRKIANYKSFKATYTGEIPPIFNPVTALDLNDLLRRLNDMSREVPTDAPWKAPKAKQWDSMTFKEFLDKTTWSALAKDVGTTIIQAVMTSEPHEVSLLYVLWLIRSGDCVERLIQIDKGAQEQKIRGGAMQLSEKMASSLDVRLKEVVIKVEQTADKCRVFTDTGNTYDSDYVISAIPQSLLNRIQFVPMLPARRFSMIQRVPVGSIIKTVTFYKEAYWRKAGFDGEIANDAGPVGYCIDDTKPDGSFPAIMGFILADRSRELCELSKEERMKLVAEQYARMFGLAEMSQPCHYEELNWFAEEFSGGCYNGAYPCGVLTQYGDVIRQPHARVHFAGTETSTTWNGYMEGAIEAGERAAREILHQEGKIPECDIYQEEAYKPVYFAEDPLEMHWIEKQLPSVGGLLRFLTGVGVVGLAAVCQSYGLMEKIQAFF